MTTSLRVIGVAVRLPLLLDVAASAMADKPPSMVVVSDYHFVNRGLAWRREAEADEQSLRLAFERLDQAIALIADDNLYGERLTILELRRIVKQMREQAPQVVAAHRKTLEATKAYGESVREAAPLLLAAAKRFEEYAADEPYDELREDYRLWGESFQAIAKKYQQQETLVPSTIAAVSENLAYVVRIEKQLVRVERLLDIVPEEGVATEQFLTRLASYVESFTLFRNRLRALHGRTVGDARPYSDPVTPTLSGSDNAVTNAELLPLAHRVGAMPTSLWGGRRSHPPSTRFALAQPVHSLIGRWDLRTDGDHIALEFYENAKSVRLRLAQKHDAISEVEGVVQSSGDRHTVKELAYVMRTGERLAFGDCALRVRNDNELAMTCPTVRRNLARKFRATKELKTSTLHRVR